MHLRSLEELDLTQAWRHVLYWARATRAVPDRLPFEVLDRIHRGPPGLEREHHLRPTAMVTATKGSGAVRPFARISPVDLLLYQALVDAVAPDIEQTLGGRDKVMAFRRHLGKHDDQFHGSPMWGDFMRSVRSVLYARSAPFGSGYALSADIASYFVYVDVDEVERRLLAVTDRESVARDLGDLLRGWQQLGIRGLPQGVPPSSALGNFYLHPVDRSLEAWGLDHRRYMDDLWVFTSSFSEARRVQDRIERLLYHDRLGFGGEKLWIRRNETALRDTRPAEERIEERRELQRELLLADVDTYSDVDPELDETEIEEVAVHGAYDDLLVELDSPKMPGDARSRLIAVYRKLERAKDPYAIKDVPQILRRMPDLTDPAMRYVEAARPEDASQAREALLELLSPGRFHREQEWLHICRTIMRFRHRPSAELAHRMAEIGREHDHPLVRARALLAWGSQSVRDDFSLADELWPTSAAQWRAYVLVSIQNKPDAERDERYDRWSGEARFLRLLAGAIRQKPFRWKVL